MTGVIQDGIYYDKDLGNSFCLMFLKISRSVHSSDLAKELADLWELCNELKSGKIKGLDTHPKHNHSGNLSVLLGYGPKIFDGIVSGIKRHKPADLKYEKGFRGPNIIGEKSIIKGSSINFSKDTMKNHAVEDHIIIQFIADTEMFTNRAIVEIWKHIDHIDKNKGNRKRTIFNISKFYTGFKRVDRRGWLGFHEGVSNMEKKDRQEAIAIKDYLSRQEDWLINGTYMTFIRFVIDLKLWDAVAIPQQEIVIGRKKITGCPIIGTDRNGNPIGVPGCPLDGTNEVTEEGNEKFREHIRYDEKNLPPYLNNKSLSISHIYRVHKTSKYPPSDFRSFRIFRQGFEFLEPIDKPPGFQVGLNFVSFQNKPQKIMKMLTSQGWLGRSMTDEYKKINGLEKYISARAAGIFLIPPINKNELFPGSIMFL